MKTILKKLSDGIKSKKAGGMGVIEIVLIIFVLVGLAFVFKTEITGVADGVYKSIKDQVDKF